MFLIVKYKRFKRSSSYRYDGDEMFRRNRTLAERL